MFSLPPLTVCCGEFFAGVVHGGLLARDVVLTLLQRLLSGLYGGDLRKDERLMCGLRRTGHLMLSN